MASVWYALRISVSLSCTHPLCAGTLQRSGHLKYSYATKLHQLYSFAHYLWGTDSLTSLPLGFSFPMPYLQSSWCSLAEYLRVEACSSAVIILSQIWAEGRVVIHHAKEVGGSPPQSLGHERDAKPRTFPSFPFLSFHYEFQLLFLGLRDLSCKSNTANGKPDLEFFIDLNYKLKGMWLKRRGKEVHLCSYCDLCIAYPTHSI